MTLRERLEQIADFVAGIFRKIPETIKGYAKQAVAIVNQVKGALDSDIAKVIVGFIPGTWDDKLRDEAVAMLTGLAAILQNIPDDGSRAAKVARSKILLGMASELISMQDGGTLPMNKYDLYAQATYTSEKKLAA